MQIKIIKDTNGKIRKLSVTCSLSDPKDYEGGELEFDFRNMDPDKPTIRNVQK
jgi:predicted 2-oxoglutarate/Fe(II)-dependent dioxygenase YbiX